MSVLNPRRTDEKESLHATQTVGVLQGVWKGAKVADLCRRHGITEVAFYRWKRKYGGLQVSEPKRLKAELAHPQVTEHRVQQIVEGTARWVTAQDQAPAARAHVIAPRMLGIKSQLIHGSGSREGPSWPPCLRAFFGLR